MNNILYYIFEHFLKVKTAFAQFNTGGGLQESGGLTLPNPFGEGATIGTVIDNIANWLIFIASPVAVIMVLYGAFQILTSAGDPKKVTEGRSTITYAIIGLAVVLISKGVALVVKSILGVNS